jgi:hypothetical protein
LLLCTGLRPGGGNPLGSVGQPARTCAAANEAGDRNDASVNFPHVQSLDRPGPAGITHRIKIAAERQSVKLGPGFAGAYFGLISMLFLVVLGRVGFFLFYVELHLALWVPCAVPDLRASLAKSSKDLHHCLFRYSTGSLYTRAYPTTGLPGTQVYPGPAYTPQASFRKVAQFYIAGR